MIQCPLAGTTGDRGGHDSLERGRVRRRAHPQARAQAGTPTRGRGGRRRREEVRDDKKEREREGEGREMIFAGKMFLGARPLQDKRSRFPFAPYLF
jgi:hypothetical protein